MGQHLFISHSAQNDEFVKKLSETLELHGQLPWSDGYKVIPVVLPGVEPLRVSKQPRSDAQPLRLYLHYSVTTPLT